MSETESGNIPASEKAQPKPADDPAQKREGDELESDKTKMIRLHEIVGLNEAYTNENFRKEFHDKWNSMEKLNAENGAILFNEPFQLCVLPNLLSNEQLTASLAKEFNEMEWFRKHMDLYEFYQTLDLCNMKNQNLKQFHDHLKTTIMPWMQEVTGIILTHVSASCSMYNAGDHLLVHDDLLFDRRIAFVYYISPWPNHRVWNEKSGGALEVFQSDDECLPIFPVVHSIFPKNNQFVFFKVCEKSFHQVAEVTTFDYPRLTINGWFHGPVDERSENDSPLTDDIKYIVPNRDDINLSEWMNNLYLIDEIKKNLQKNIEINSEACLEEFLIPEIYEVMSEYLQTDPNLEWRIKGPAHLRKYEVLCLDKLKGGPILDLLQIFSSRDLFQLLYEYTELDLYGKNAENPMCSFEMQRWQKGCYSVLGDSSSYSDSTLDLVMYFNPKENVGTITYLAPEEDPQQHAGHSDDIDEDEDPILLTICPKSNNLNIVFRSEGTTKFTKYVSKNTSVEGDEYSYILVCSYKE